MKHTIIEDLFQTFLTASYPHRPDPGSAQYIQLRDSFYAGAIATLSADKQEVIYAHMEFLEELAKRALLQMKRGYGVQC